MNLKQNPKTQKSSTRPPNPPKKRRSGRRTLHYMIVIFIMLIIGIVFSLTLFFKIEDIRVDNIDYYTDEEIIQATELELETNLFLAKTSHLPEKLKSQFPYIEEITIKRTLPPAIEIDIYPSIPAAALQHGDEYALITPSGKVLERGLVLMPSDVILVKGVELAHRQPGDYLGKYTKKYPAKGATEAEEDVIRQENIAGQLQADQERDALSVVSYLLDAIDKTDFKGITNLDLTNPLNMTIMYENRLLLKLGTELRLEYKLNYLKTAIANLHPKAHGVLNAENAPKSGKVIFTPMDGYDMNGYPITGRDAKTEEDKELLDPESSLESPIIVPDEADQGIITEDENLSETEILPLEEENDS